MSIKKAYYYLFYKFYKFGEWTPSSFPSDWTAGFSISILETALVFSLKFYYIEFFDHNNNIKLYSPEIIVPLLVIFIGNSFAFVISSKWKYYIIEFDNWPKSKNLLGTWIVVGIILLTFFIIISSMYMLGPFINHSKQ